MDFWQMFWKNNFLENCNLNDLSRLTEKTLDENEINNYNKNAKKISRFFALRSFLKFLALLLLILFVNRYLKICIFKIGSCS